MKRKVIVILFFLLAVVLSGVFTKDVNAQFPFGGYVTSSIFCPCSGNFLISVEGPLGGQFAFNPWNTQFANYQLPRSGIWTLGLFTPGGACLFPSFSGCTPGGFPIGTITPIVGTSL